MKNDEQLTRLELAVLGLVADGDAQPGWQAFLTSVEGMDLPRVTGVERVLERLQQRSLVMRLLRADSEHWIMTPAGRDALKSHDDARALKKVMARDSPAALQRFVRGEDPDAVEKLTESISKAPRLAPTFSIVARVLPLAERDRFVEHILAMDNPEVLRDLLDVWSPGDLDEIEPGEEPMPLSEELLDRLIEAGLRADMETALYATHTVVGLGRGTAHQHDLCRLLVHSGTALQRAAVLALGSATDDFSAAALRSYADQDDVLGSTARRALMMRSDTTDD